MSSEIPRIDLVALSDAAHPDHAATRVAVARAAEEIGFMTVTNTAVTRAEAERLIAAYRAFFHLPARDKARVDMAATGANRGWGAPRSEQVDPTANPDFKEVFDCGHPLPAGDPRTELAVYAPNRWPDLPAEFRPTVEAYYAKAMGVAMAVLRGVAGAVGMDTGYFDDKFDPPMALLRGNFYPARPAGAGARDFGIAPHTDYGCLTLLATDGAPGLEVLGRDGAWVPVAAAPGAFVINFGEMLEFWTAGKVVATLHRVVGGPEERISVPLFFNPAHDTNVAPPGSGQVIRAGEHLNRRFRETYLHLKDA